VTSDSTKPIFTLTATDAAAHTDDVVTMVSTPHGGTQPFWEAYQEGRRRLTSEERARKKAARKRAKASKRRNRR
jgi:hypothetical protein